MTTFAIAVTLIGLFGTFSYSREATFSQAELWMTGNVGWVSTLFKNSPGNSRGSD